MVDKATGLPMLDQEERARPLQTPRVFGICPDIPARLMGRGSMVAAPVNTTLKKTIALMATTLRRQSLAS